MSVCTTCFSLTLTLLDGREGRKREVAQFYFLFATQPNLHADTVLILLLPLHTQFS